MRVKVFLASSAELEEDRKEFALLLSLKNSDWEARGVYLDLVKWEDYLDAMSKTRLQDEYNKAIRECDVFVALFWTKVGKFTEEEFETAFGLFKATNRPFIFTYFKDTEISIGSANRDDLKSLWAFQDKLKALGHFYTPYKNVDELKFHFNRQLEKLAASESWFESVAALGALVQAWKDAQESGIDLQKAKLDIANSVASRPQQPAAARSTTEAARSTGMVIDQELLGKLVADINAAKSRFAAVFTDPRYTPADIDREEERARLSVCAHLKRIRDFNAGALPSTEMESLSVSFRCEG